MRERHGPIQVSTYLNMELNLLPIRRPGNEINSLPLTDGRTDGQQTIDHVQTSVPDSVQFKGINHNLVSAYSMDEWTQNAAIRVVDDDVRMF